MMNPLKKNLAQAKVVDGKLILSFPHAVTPIVWQMDLGDAKGSAFEVTEDKENNHAVLISRKQGSTKTDIIAPFTKKEEAVQALMATSNALENAYGQINPAAYAAPQQNNGQGATPASTAMNTSQAHIKGKTPWGKILGSVFGIALIIILFGVMQNLKPRKIQPGGATASAFAGGAEEANSPDAAGVPISADDFLRQN